MEFSNTSFFHSFKKFGILALSVAAIFSCGKISSPDPQLMSTTKVAVVATGIWGSGGAHSLISYSAPRQVQNDLFPTGDDLRMFSYGKYFYQLERSSSNSITKFSIDNPSKVIWSFSTDEPSDTNSNPSAIIFVNEAKAYLLRYNSTKAWIVNPSATTEAEFKTGKYLDLSSYADADGAPEMASGVIVGDKLFIALQKYDMAAGPVNKSYLVVFDINTDTQIADIELAVRNPAGKIKYYDGYIYVPAADDYYSWPSTATYGGIQRVNATTYVADPVIISPNTHITNVEIVSPTKGYFVLYTGWGNNSLKSFDPQTGNIAAGNVAQIGDTNDRSINDIITDSNGLLWMADASSLVHPGIYIIDPSTDTIQEGPLFTNLNPLEIAFCEM